jgi:hypothetical protein
MEAALHSNTCGCRLIAAPGFLTCAGGRMASALGSSRGHGWAFAVDPPRSFDRSPALTGSARRRSPVAALWPRRPLHLVSSKTA